LPPSFNEADVSDKLAWVQALPLSCQDRPVSECEEGYKQKQLETVRNLASLDRSVEALLNFLDSKGQLSNTLIITSTITAYFKVSIEYLKKIHTTKNRSRL